jgi:hypothetical protein
MHVQSILSAVRGLATRLWRRLDVCADDPGIEQDWFISASPPRTDAAQVDPPGRFDRPTPAE